MTMHPQPILAVLVVAGLGLAPASAETLTVCATGCDYTSINAAVDAASDGYVILLSAETYTEGSVISTDGKAIILRGAGAWTMLLSQVRQAYLGRTIAITRRMAGTMSSASLTSSPILCMPP